MPGLRRQRPCPIRLLGRFAVAACHRGDVDQGRDAQSYCPHAGRGRALRAQPQARPPARTGGTFPHHNYGISRPDGNRSAVLCDRPRRTGAHARSRTQPRRSATAVGARREKWKTRRSRSTNISRKPKSPAETEQRAAKAANAKVANAKAVVDAGVGAVAVAAVAVASRVNLCRTRRQNFTQDTAPEHTVTHEDHDGGSPEEDGLGQPQPRQEGASGEGETREGRRRRRRGRRGGRRNRQRNGEAPFRSAENGSEPELHQRPTNSTLHGLITAGMTSRNRPSSHPSPKPEPQAPVFSAQESPRRRSTTASRLRLRRNSAACSRTRFAAGSGDLQHRH